MRAKYVACLAIAVIVFGITPARADGPATPTQDARSLTVAAKQAFDGGRFVEAADLLNRAYALQPTPVLLYNMGRAYQQAGEKEKAIDAYERYLAAARSAPDEGAVRTTIDALRKDLDEQARLRDEAMRAQQRADDEKRKRDQERQRLNAAAQHKPSPWPWITTGVGVGGVVTGIVFGVLANGAHADAVAAAVASDAERRQSQATSFALGANIAFAAGGAIALTGLIWGIFDVRAAQRSIVVGFSPTSVTIGGTF